ncbi:hypothetical protein [Levilactobacillus brevis]|uniref:hypothetical protein n=1 Tax=Levilactobacillus brevis TaxID=1580 RepID=UPI003D178DF5
MVDQVQTRSVTVSQKAMNDVVYWKRWSWEEDLQRVLVVVNQRATGSLLVDSPTDCLIRREMASRGMTGEVTVAYLTEDKDESSELLSLTRRADFVVLAVGTKVDSLVEQKLKLYIQQSQSDGQNGKIYWLMNSGGKHVHPVELARFPWQFGPVD